MSMPPSRWPPSRASALCVIAVIGMGVLPPAMRDSELVEAPTSYPLTHSCAPRPLDFGMVAYLPRAALRPALTLARLRFGRPTFGAFVPADHSPQLSFPYGMSENLLPRVVEDHADGEVGDPVQLLVDVDVPEVPHRLIRHLGEDVDVADRVAEAQVAV